MPDPTTTNIVLAVPTRGTDAGTWDTPVNGDMIILDACAGSVTTKTLSNANVSLSVTESQVNILRLTGTLTGNVVITLGAVIKSWVVENLTLGGLTTGSFTLKIQGSTGTGNVIGVPPGACQIYWDGTNVSFVNLGRIGEYLDYAGPPGGVVVPPWVTACTVPPYLYCDGSPFSAVTYPLLAAIIGGTTLPDFRGRVRAYADGGVSRLTTAGSGIDGNTLFAAGGQQNVTLDVTQIPAHAHGVTDPQHSHTLNNASNLINGSSGNSFGGGAVGSAVSVTVNSAATGISIQNAGGGLSHLNVQPTIVGGVVLIRAA